MIIAPGWLFLINFWGELTEDLKIVEQEIQYEGSVWQMGRVWVWFSTHLNSNIAIKIIPNPN